MNDIVAPGITRTQWEQFGLEVDGGTFFLHPDVARGVLAACDEYRASLVESKRLARHLALVDGFGTLPSGQALRDKFSRKAVGGDDALVDVLASHITVIDEMRAFFTKCIESAQNQESENAASLRNLDFPR